MVRPVVLFDLDGTLVDTHRDIAAALNVALRAVGEGPLTDDAVRGLIGRGLSSLLRSALRADDGDPRIEVARAAFLPAYAEGLTRTSQWFPGVAALLPRLALRADLGVATNKPARFTADLARALAFEPLGLRALASQDEVGAPKPDPRVLELALRRLGRTGAVRLAYVGDMAIDVETARAFGASAFGVTWGYDPVGVARARPDALVDTAEALLAGLEAWLDRAAD